MLNMVNCDLLVKHLIASCASQVESHLLSHAELAGLQPALMGMTHHGLMSGVAQQQPLGLPPVMASSLRQYCRCESVVFPAAGVGCWSLLMA